MLNENVDILTGGIEEIIVREHLEAALKSGKKLRVKFGIDPTAPQLHLGHLVALRKLRQFQDAGHKVVLIIGDLTATIGDPSFRSETRKPLTEKEVKINLKKYLEEAGKFIDIKKAEVRYNSEWHKKNGLASMLELAGAATIQQVLKRADFQERLAKDADISVLEIFYPLFQGYDSVAVRADLEIGGTDQKFNLLTGRRVQRHYKMAEQDIMTLPLLEGTDGVRKMSKSYGNIIALAESPTKIFGEVMTIPDGLIKKYASLLTGLNLGQEIKTSPYDAKRRLAKEIVKICHGQKEAEKAAQNFKKVFSQKELPDDIPEIKLLGEKIELLELILKTGITSKGEARRLIEQGAVEVGQEKKNNPKEIISLSRSFVLKVGKTRFFKIISGGN